MMKGVEDMAKLPVQDSEPDPTWEEAVAEFEAGQPVELIRSPRSLVIEYRYADGRWLATSPRLTGLSVSAASLPEAKTLVAESLEGYLDPAVSIYDHVAGPEESRAAPQELEILEGGEILVHQHTRGRSSAFVSSRSLKSRALKVPA